MIYGAGFLCKSLYTNLNVVQIAQHILPQPIILAHYSNEYVMYAASENALEKSLLLIATAWQKTPSEVLAMWASGDHANVAVDPVTKFAIALAYFARGYEKDGRQKLQQIPGAWKFAYISGLYIYYQNKYQEALVWFERAFSIDTSIPV